MNLPSLLTGFFAAVLGCASMAGAQEGGPPIPKPTAEHKILSADEGTWDATVKAFMAGPDAEPTVSKGVEVNTMMPGGLWLISKFEGEFFGMKFEGRGQFGYDPLKKAYVGTWLDSMTPTLSVLEGTYDAKTKTMTFVGDGVDPNTKSKYTQKMVTATKDDGTRVFTLIMKSDETGGKEAKFMEITYTKRK
ncbi:MAG: hypothetical protein JWN86_931 [Planctomycetota bacterium]|nr:hypothetical protein [Planctomycetota bacterium]